jgi:hypothetical protein
LGELLCVREPELQIFYIHRDCLDSALELMHMGLPLLLAISELFIDLLESVILVVFIKKEILKQDESVFVNLILLAKLSQLKLVGVQTRIERLADLFNELTSLSHQVKPQELVVRLRGEGRWVIA